MNKIKHTKEQKKNKQFFSQHSLMIPLRKVITFNSFVINVCMSSLVVLFFAFAYRRFILCSMWFNTITLLFCSPKSFFLIMLNCFLFCVLSEFNIKIETNNWIKTVLCDYVIMFLLSFLHFHSQVMQIPIATPYSEHNRFIYIFCVHADVN